MLLSADILCGLAITMPAFMAYENSAAEQSVTSYNGYNAVGRGYLDLDFNDRHAKLWQEFHIQDGYEVY